MKLKMILFSEKTKTSMKELNLKPLTTHFLSLSKQQIELMEQTLTKKTKVQKLFHVKTKMSLGLRVGLKEDLSNC